MKKAFLRGLLGFPLGVFAGLTISIVISLIMEDGAYMPVVPSLLDQCPTEISAVILQYTLCGVLGGAAAAGSVVWEIERWSLLRQTVVYFSILAVTMLPVAYFAHWMEHSLAGFISYFAIFIVMYAIIWFIQYFIWKKKIRLMNEKLQRDRGKE